jgi:hypothetical protein
MYGYEAAEKKKSEKINCKIKMPKIFIKGNCVETLWGLRIYIELW